MLPIEFIEQYIYQYVGYVKKKPNGKLIGGCPICHEGKSWGKKTRFNYNSNREGNGKTVVCHNCGYRNTSIGFIADVTGMDFKDIYKESQEYDIIPNTLNDYNVEYDNNTKNVKTLPDDSINLFDPLQVNFYKDNKIIKLALDYIKTRKLCDSPNKPKTFYISLKDYIHKNRLIIPYYDNGKIVWYQSRKLLDDDSPKYLSKVDSERSLFNIDNIDIDIPYIFIFEGAIDSMFVQNATCVSGITENGDFTLTNLQKEQFRRFPFHEKIWVLDSPYKDDAARNKTQQLFGNGEKIFKWPEKIGKQFKDFNDIIIQLPKNEITYEFIIGNLMKKNNLYDNVKSLLSHH